MRIFALADPHLSNASEKPMDVFGTRWKNHAERIKENWIETVCADDIVILSGDISWGLKMEEVMPDLAWLHELPGTKLITKGNHDIWWTSLSKMNAFFDDIIFIHNNYYQAGDVYICGTRGWLLPQNNSEWSEHDEKIYRREILRLEASLEAAAKSGAERIIVSMHYPPVYAGGRPSDFTDVIERFPVTDVIYGHLHGDDAARYAFTGKKQGIRYRLVASDGLNFCPKLIYDEGWQSEK